MIRGRDIEAGLPAKLVFVSKLHIDCLCFGRVGRNSLRFCLAELQEGLDHCGITSHAWDKFPAPADHYYADGETSKGRLTAKTNPTVAQTSISPDKVLQF